MARTAYLLERNRSSGSDLPEPADLVGDVTQGSWEIVRYPAGSPPWLLTKWEQNYKSALPCTAGRLEL
jgi:hypothetical protein